MEVIAAPGAAEFLESGHDVCFGKHFAKSATECIACRAPVVLDGKVFVMREVCATRCLGGKSAPESVVRLTSQQVLERVEQGVPLDAIFQEILADAPLEIAGSIARQLLVDRLMYLQTIGLPKREVPRLAELKKAIIIKEKP